MRLWATVRYHFAVTPVERGLAGKKGQVAMRAFRRLTFFSVIATYLLIFVGGLVRVSGAGLGCPDWPRCFGRWFPPLSASDLPADIDPAKFNFTLAWIEYFNRLCGVTVGFLILAVAIAALVRFRKESKILGPSLAAALLTAYQGWQGGRVVASELQSILVSAHLLISFVIVSLLIYVGWRSYVVERSRPSAPAVAPARMRLWVFLLWLGGLSQILLGTMVRSGVEQVSGQFPLLSDLEWLSRVGAPYDLHMISGSLLAIASIVIGLAIPKMVVHPSPLLRQTVWGMVILMVAQILIGFILLAFGLTAVLQLFHLWMAGLYIGLVLLLYLQLASPATEPGAVAPRATRMVAPVTVLLALIAVLAILVTGRAEASRRAIPVLYDVPAFNAVESHGEPFGLASLHGKISVVDFFFTSCRGPCPYMSATYAELYRLYAHSDKLQLVSFTVDPETDSLPILRAYAERFGVTDYRWRFARMQPEEISRFCEEGFKVSGDLPGMHSTKFVLVDAEARIRGYFDYDNPAAIDLLKQQIQQLVREMP